MMTTLDQSPSPRDDLVEQQTIVKATILAQELTEQAEAAQAPAEAMTRELRSSERINLMVTEVLDLASAPLGGGLLLVPKSSDLHEICRNVVEEFGATIQLELEGDLTGTWDQDRLAQALSTLARNANEYRAPGTSMIVKAHVDGDEAVVEMINYGKSIPSDVRPFIFESFRRAQQREKSATGSPYLGLYIAHQIVQSHGGSLDAHSADGTTAFVICQPRIPPPFPHGPV